MSSHLTARKFSSGSWPLIRTNSPWEVVDEESEYLYNEALVHYAEKLQGERSKFQIRLDQYVPKKGAYANARGRYLKICHRPRNNNGIYAVKLSEDASTLTVGYENGCVEMIDLLNECSVPMKLAIGANPPSAIKYDPNRHDHIYISTTSGLIFLCYPEPPDYDTWSVKKIISEGKNETFALSINSVGDRLITGGSDCRLRIYDMETNDLLNCYKGFTLECKDSYARLLEEDEQEGHYLPIYSIVCHPEKPWLFASAGLDSNIKIWDLRVKQFAVKNISGPHIMGDSIDLKDNIVLSGQWASSEGLQIWDSGSCRLLKTFVPTNMCPQSFGQYFYCAKFFRGPNNISNEDLVIAGGAGMGGLLVGSFSENLILALYEDEGSILCLDNQGDMLAYGGTSHILYVSEFLYNTVEAPSDSEDTATFGEESRDYSGSGKRK